MRIDVLMFEGVAEVDALATYAVFANARSRGLEVEPRLVTADGAREVTGCYGTKFAELEPWDPSSARVLAVSGGWILEEIERGVIPRQLAEAKEASADLILAGIDSGSLLLGAAGLINGRPATTHRADYGRLAEWAEVIDARIVDDGDLVTCGSGWLAGIDLAYWLLERELDAAATEVVALEQWTGRDRQGTVWRRPLP